ncbi:MAG: flavin reductase family protein [Hyphomonadaceae bacterium]
MGCEFDQSHWRAAMGGCLSGVNIVTTWKDGAPAGTAVNAFCAVSLHPPLLLVCLDKNSRTLSAIAEAGVFCVNVLSERQASLVSVFADKTAGDRFAQSDYVRGATGAPVLAGSLSWFDCEVHATHVEGDHTIVVGRVVDLDTDAALAPLAYRQGRVWPLTSDPVDS